MVSVSYKLKSHRIEEVVRSFYEKATIDFLIGYQFRKIQTLEGADPTKPPIEAFDSHLPRIAQFWKMQLLGEKLNDQQPYNLINIHKELRMNKGELGRWVKLFRETIESYKVQDKEQLDLLEMYDDWNEKITWFEQKFLSIPGLF
jgi:truncated hemoglobin YjbI